MLRTTRVMSNQVTQAHLPFNNPPLVIQIQSLIDEVISQSTPLTPKTYQTVFRLDSQAQTHRLYSLLEKHHQLSNLAPLIQALEKPTIQNKIVERITQILEGYESFEAENITSSHYLPITDTEILQDLQSTDPGHVQATTFQLSTNPFHEHTSHHVTQYAKEFLLLSEGKILQASKIPSYRNIPLFLSHLPVLHKLSYVDATVNPRSLEMLFETLSHLPSLSGLGIDSNTLHALSPNQILSLKHSLSSLHSLEYIGDQTPPTSQSLHNFTTLSQEIIDLDLRRFPLGQIPGTLLKDMFSGSCLKSLKFPSLTNEGMNYEQFHDLFHDLNNLKLLSIDAMDWGKVSLNHIQNFFKTTQLLTHLSLLNVIFPYNIQVWKRFCESLPKNLLSVELSDIDFYFTPMHIKGLTEQCSSLRHLGLSSCHLGNSMTLESFGLLIKGLPNLQSLNLSSQLLCNWSEEYYQLIHAHPKLKHLQMSHCGFQSLAVEKLGSIANQLVGLETLVFDGANNRLTDLKALKAWYTPLVGLRTIKVPYGQSQTILSLIPELKGKILE